MCWGFDLREESTALHCPYQEAGTQKVRGKHMGVFKTGNLWRMVVSECVNVCALTDQ